LYPQCSQCHPDYGSLGCSIRCAAGKGIIRDIADGGSSSSTSSAILPVVPIVDCVSPSTSTAGAYVAWLGYENFNPTNVYIPVGPDNQFLPTPSDLNRAPFVSVAGGSLLTSTTRVAADLGQPTKFLPGRVHKVFSVALSSADVRISWMLTNVVANQANNEVDILASFGTACLGNEVALSTSSEISSGVNLTSSQVCQCLPGFWDRHAILSVLEVKMVV